MPLSLWSWQDALRAVFNEKATVISEYNIVIKSPRIHVKVPSVVALKKFQKSPESVATMNRRNVFIRDGYKCQYCNKNMLPKSLKYSHYQNCQGFKKINKITDKTPKPTEQPPEAPPPPPPPPPPTTIAIPKSKPKPKPKPKPQEEIVEESPTKNIDKPHPRTERMNLIKERYNFNISKI
jgi:hypothetical protein